MVLHQTLTTTRSFVGTFVRARSSSSIDNPANNLVALCYPISTGMVFLFATRMSLKTSASPTCMEPDKNTLVWTERPRICFSIGLVGLTEIVRIMCIVIKAVSRCLVNHMLLMRQIQFTRSTSRCQNLISRDGKTLTHRRTTVRKSREVLVIIIDPLMSGTRSMDSRSRLKHLQGNSKDSCWGLTMRGLFLA